MPNYNLVPEKYSLNSNNQYVARALQAKAHHAKNVNGYGSQSCWACVGIKRRNSVSYALGCSQLQNDILGISPYKNQWVKYHGEISAVAQALSAYWNSRFQPTIDAVYIEMSPCNNCEGALDNLLPNNTTVYYSFDYATEINAWSQAATQLCK